MEEEIGAIVLSLCATEVGICWHSCWATAVELASTDSGDAEEARRSCEIEATSPCPTGEGGGAIADCCEVRISISEESGASSNEDGADNRQGVSFMVKDIWKEGLQSIKIQVHPAAMLGLAIRRASMEQQTIKDLPTVLAVHSAAMLGLAIRRARIDQLTIKDLPTALAPHPAAMLGLAIRRSRIDQQSFGGIRKALLEGVHICLAHW